MKTDQWGSQTEPEVLRAIHELSAFQQTRGCDRPGWAEAGERWTASQSSAPRESKEGGVTQPKLILQVPEASAVLGPFPEKVGLAVLPPLEHLRGERAMRRCRGSPRARLWRRSAASARTRTLGRGPLRCRELLLVPRPVLQQRSQPVPAGQGPPVMGGTGMLMLSCTPQRREDSGTCGAPR